MPFRMCEELAHDGVAHDLDVAAQREVVRIGVPRLDELGVRVPRAVLLQGVADQAAPVGPGRSDGDGRHWGAVISDRSIADSGQEESGSFALAAISYLRPRYRSPAARLARAFSSSSPPSFSASPRDSSSRTRCGCRGEVARGLPARDHHPHLRPQRRRRSPSTRSRSASSLRSATSRRISSTPSSPPRTPTSTITAASIRRRSSAPSSRTHRRARRSKGPRRSRSSSPSRSSSRRRRASAARSTRCFLAVEIEKDFTKDQIFELYANQVYLGHGAYGVESASRLYFGKHAKDLTHPRGGR